MGEVDGEAGQVVGSGGEGEGGVVLAEDVGNEHQAEAAVGAFRGEKRRENLVGNLRGDSGTVINNLQLGRGGSDGDGCPSGSIST